MTYLLLARPFDQVRANLTELVNEGTFLLLLSGQFYYYEEARWSSTTTNSFIWVLMGNNVAVIFISFSAFALDVFLKFYRKKPRQERVTPKERKKTEKEKGPKRIEMQEEPQPELQFDRSGISATYSRQDLRIEECKDP
jgi:hypothetical protein